MRSGRALLLAACCWTAALADSSNFLPIAQQPIIAASWFDQLTDLAGETFTDLIDKTMQDTEGDTRGFFDKLQDAAKDTWEGLVDKLKAKVIEELKVYEQHFEQWTQQYGVLGEAMRAAKDIGKKQVADLNFQTLKFDMTKAASELAMKLAGEGAVTAAALLQDKVIDLQAKLALETDPIQKGILQVQIASINSTMVQLKDLGNNGEAALSSSMQTIVSCIAQSLGKVSQDITTELAGKGMDALKKVQKSLMDQLDHLFDAARKKSSNLGGAILSARTQLLAKRAELEERMKPMDAAIAQAIAANNPDLKAQYDAQKQSLSSEIDSVIARLDVNQNKVIEQINGAQTKVNDMITKIVADIEKLTNQGHGRRLAGQTAVSNFIQTIKDSLSGQKDKLTAIKTNLQSQLDIFSGTFNVDGKSLVGTTLMETLGKLYAQLKACTDTTCDAAKKERILGDIGTQEAGLDKLEDKIAKVRAQAESTLMTLASDILQGIGKNHKMFQTLTGADATAMKSEIVLMLNNWQDRAQSVWDAFTTHTSGIEASIGPGTDILAETIGKLAAQLTGSSGNLKTELETQLKGLRKRYDNFRASLTAEMSTGQESLAEVLFGVGADVGSQVETNSGASLANLVKTGVKGLRDIVASAWDGQRADSAGVEREVAGSSTLLAKSIGALRQKLRAAVGEVGKVLQDKLNKLEDRLSQLRGGLRQAWELTWEKVNFAKERASNTIAKLQQALTTTTGTVRTQVQAALTKMKALQDKMGDVSDITATFDDKLLGLADKMALYQNDLRDMAGTSTGTTKEILNFVVGRMSWLSSNLRTAGDQVANLQEKFEVGQTRTAEMLGSLEGLMENVASDDKIAAMLKPATDKFKGFLDSISGLQAELEPKIQGAVDNYLGQFKAATSSLAGIVDSVATEQMAFAAEDAADETMAFRRRLSQDIAIQTTMDCLDQVQYAVHELSGTQKATGELQDLRSAAVAEKVARLGDGKLSGDAQVNIDGRVVGAYKESTYKNKYYEASIPEPDYDGKSITNDGTGGSGTKVVLWILVVLAIVGIVGGIAYYVLSQRPKDGAPQPGTSEIELRGV